MKISKDLLRNYLVTRRSFMLLAGKLSLLSLLSLRMLYIQIIEGSKYKTLSDKNRVNVIMLPPNRGKITDIDGKLIADNSNVFNLKLDKLENPKYQESLELISKLLSLKPYEFEVLEKKAKKVHRRFPGNILENLSWKQVSIIEENITSLKGIYVDVGQSRNYHFNEVLSHPIGYISSLSDADKKEYGINQMLDIEVGKSGIEKTYEENLRGEFGFKEAEVNAHGQIIREISHKQSISGENMKLNIDAELQTKAMSLIPKRGGSISILDLKDGKLIVAASSPGFKPNEFSGRLSPEYWNSMLKNPHKPLVNKLVQNNYPPGSIFKMAVVLAALESGMDPNQKIECTGDSVLGKKHFKCWYRPGHGKINLKKAIKHSCNTYMYHIAKEIGESKIIETARKFGFGSLTGVDIPNESAGLLPSKEWKMQRFGQKWHLGDSLNTSIGQGFVLATPLQMTRFTAAIASNKLITPKIYGESYIQDINIDEDHLNFIRSSMYDVMNQPGGTGYYHRIKDSKWLIAGKTGTCQVRSKLNDENLSAITVPWRSRNHALFSAYGPFDNPRFAITIMVDHGGGASAALPIGKDMLLAAFKKYL